MTVHCPKCQSPHSYEDGHLWVCPECAHEWALSPEVSAAIETQQVKDAYGNVLKTGDSVTVVKELKIRGSSQAVKVGTKVKNIRVIDDAEDGHNLACKIDGLGAINLKSEFVRKA